MNKRAMICILLVATMTVFGCAGMSDTEQRTLSGGAMGAGAGALVGAIAGNTGMGLAIGAATGVAGGYLYGKHEDSKKAAYEDGYKAGQQSKP